MEDILINCTPRENRVAVIVDDILEDVHIERTQSRGLVGNVYKGKVIRVLPGMQSAFIDIGLERTGFLHVMDIESAHGPDGIMKPIEKILCEGVCLMVQVAKDPIGTKGARLTTTISLAGRKLVYLPHDNHIGVSQRTRAAIDGGLLRLWTGEAAKWCATLGIALGYCLTGRVRRAAWLVRMRRQITAGLLTPAE